MLARRRILIALGLFVGLSAVASAADEPTLGEVLDRYYQAVGGKDKLDAMKTVKMTGKMMMGPGVDAPFILFKKRPDKLRIEFTVQGMTGVQAYDGSTAWMFMPFMGKTAPEEVPEDQAKELKEEADIDGPLVDWQKKGNQVELLGKEEIEGTPAYKLKVTLKDGDVQYHYLDADAYVPIKIEGERTIQGNEVQFESTLGDYKEAGGLMFPFSIESKAKGAPQGQTITIDSIEVNPEIPDSQFAMPEAPAPETKGGGSR